MTTKIRLGLLLSLGALGVGAAVWNARRSRAEDPCGPDCEKPRDRPAIACNLAAFTPDERRAHEAEGAQLMKRVISTRELADGFEIRLPAVIAADVAHWFIDERRCCPFLSFDMSLSAAADNLVVSLRGPEGTKDILRSAVEQK